MYQTKNLGLNITEIKKDSLSAFNFDTDLGDNFKAIDEKTLSHRNITNCLLEVPQDIKLELVDGVLTLKEGSKVYFPNGIGVFDELVTTQDFVLEVGYTTPGQRVLVLDSNLNGFNWYLSAECYSSNAQPDNYGLWWDLTNNIIVKSDTQSRQSLPIALFTTTNNSIASIDQVFNGFGYIGSTVFALPGVKCLIPRGRNEDGSLKSDLFTSTTVKIHSATSDYSNPAATMVFDSLGNIGV